MLPDESHGWALFRAARRLNHSPHFRKRLITGNESHLAGLHLGDAAAHLVELCPPSVGRDAATEGFHKPISKLGTFDFRQVVYLLENMGHRLGHE